MKGLVIAAARAPLASCQCIVSKLTATLVAVLFLSLLARSASADSACPTCPSTSASWIFRPSYYSHDPATTVRIGRQYSHGPVFYRPQGEYIKSGYNYIRSGIQVGGQTFEQVNQWDSWYQVGGQF